MSLTQNVRHRHQRYSLAFLLHKYQKQVFKAGLVHLQKYLIICGEMTEYRVEELSGKAEVVV